MLANVSCYHNDMQCDVPEKNELNRMLATMGHNSVTARPPSATAIRNTMKFRPTTPWWHAILPDSVTDLSRDHGFNMAWQHAPRFWRCY